MIKYTQIFILLLATTAWGQQFQKVESMTVHGSYLEQTVKLESGEADSIVVEFPGYGYNDDARIDSLDSDALPDSNWTAADSYWSGYAEIDVMITNVDLATDSLIASVYSLDRAGNVRSNDVVYLKMDVYPSWDTSAYYNSWTTAVTMRGLVTGAFGKGTHGLLIVLNPTDETASHSGSARVRVFL